MLTSAPPLYGRVMDETPVTEERQLTVREAAKLAGMKPATWRGRVTRGTAPKPDGRYDLRTPWWRESTVRKFIAERKPAGRPRKSG